MAVLGLCHRFVQVLDFKGQLSSSSTGVWELPTAWELACGLCSQTGRRDRGDFSSLSPHYLCRSLPFHGMVLLKLKDNGSRIFWHFPYGNLKSYQDQNASDTKSHYKVVFKV